MYIDYVSEKIPRQLIKRRELYRTDGSHIVNVVNVIPNVSHQYFSFTYLNSVCTEMGQPGHEGSSSFRGVPTCGGCGKPYSWFLFFCVSCGSEFIRDFYHPKFCNLYPCCWDCVQELPWSYCPDHGTPIPDDAEAARLTRPPVGLNPRKFTAEELENVFDF